MSAQRMGNASRKELAPVFVISVDDPQKVGDPIRSFTLYTVHTRVRSCTLIAIQRFNASYIDYFTTLPKIRLFCVAQILRLSLAL